MKRILSENIRKVTLPLHVLGVASVGFLFWSGEWSRLWGSLIFWFLFSGLGLAIGYHRLLSHSAFETSLWIKRSLAFLGLFAGQGAPVFWVATHRSLHHPFSDSTGDPHSPREGWFHSYIGWQFFFDRSRFNPRHAVDLLRDPFLKAISLYYHRIYWLFVALIFLFDWRLGFGSLIPGMILSYHQENIVNTFCHHPSFGYRRFETGDRSRNIWILGLLFWGQALHNNHHRYPKKWNFSACWWEIDPCIFIVPLIAKRERGSRKKIPGSIRTAPPLSIRPSARELQ